MSDLGAEFESWWESAKQGVLGIAQQYCRAPSRGFDASDIAQEVALMAYLQHRDRRKFESARQLAAWARRRTHWVCLDKLKVLHPTLSLDDIGVDPPSTTVEPADAAIRSDLLQVVRQLLATIPPEQRAVLKGRLEGKTDAQIALELKKTLDNVRSLARYAVRALAEKLDSLEK